MQPGGVSRQLPGIKAFSETDFTEDLKKFDIPTLIMHGDDDQVVPIAEYGASVVKIVKNAVLKVYPGFPHGMCQTHKDVINAICIHSATAEETGDCCLTGLWRKENEE